MKCRLTIIVLWTALTTHINAREGADILQFRAGLPSCMVSSLLDKRSECGTDGRCQASCSIPDIPVSVCAPMDINCLCDNKDLDNALSACATSRCSKVLQLQIQRLVKTTCGVKVRTPSARAVAINWISFGCAFIAISMRLIGRLPRFGGQYSWDDYAMIICLVRMQLLTTYVHTYPLTAWRHCVLHSRSTISECRTRSRHMDVVSQADQQCAFCKLYILRHLETTDTHRSQYFYLEQFIYIFLVVVPKISITFLYLRLFSDRSFQRQCLVVIVLSILFLVTSFVGTGLQCYPIRHVWEGWQLDTPPRCVEMRIQIYAYAVFNIILDIVVFTLPIRQVRERF